MHRSYPGCPPAPYSVGYVQLDEGPMIMAGLVEANRDYHCGEPVDAHALRRDDGTTVMQFAAATGSPGRVRSDASVDGRVSGA